MKKKTLSSKVRLELSNHNQWIDPYDAEVIKNRYARGVSKRIALFINTPFYKLGIFKKKKWDENYILLGTAALNMKDKFIVRECLQHLNVPNKTYWGLPVDWHTKKYVFPKGTIMSTTTAECILFLLKVYEKYPDLLEEDYLIEITENLLNSLNKININSEDFLFSYTNKDDYQVFNSNLLVASAIGCVGSTTGTEKFINISRRIIEVCDEHIPKEGFVPYYLGDDEKSNDAYHQLFSMRSIALLKKYQVIEKEKLNRTIDYFEKTNFNEGKILLHNKETVFDFQPYAEALRYYGITDNKEKFLKVLGMAQFFENSRGYSQRIWIFKGIIIKSRINYHRQGLLRFYAGLSYGSEKWLSK